MSEADSLRRVPLFSTLSEQALQRLAGRVTRRRYAAGDCILEADASDAALYLLLEGLVKLAASEPVDGETLWATLGRGARFGEMTLMGSEALRGEIRCLSAVAVLRLGRADFLEVLTEDPQTAISIAEGLGKRLSLAGAEAGGVRLTTKSPDNAVGWGARRFELLRHFMEEGIPFNAHLGVEVDMLEAGHVVLRLPFRPAFIGDPFRPALHGGVVSTLCDTAGGAACFGLLESASDRVSTIDLRVDYLQPGPAEDLYCEAKVLRMGSRVAQTTMSVYAGSVPKGDDEVEPIATAYGVYSVCRR